MRFSADWYLFQFNRPYCPVICCKRINWSIADRMGQIHRMRKNSSGLVVMKYLQQEENHGAIHDDSLAEIRKLSEEKI
jgi:hypothetical protein